MKTLEKNKFIFKTQRYIRENHAQLSKHHFGELCKVLPKNVYWIQPAPRGTVLWNWGLLESYLLIGAEDPTHRSLLEEFVSTLHTAA